MMTFARWMKRNRPATALGLALLSVALPAGAQAAKPAEPADIVTLSAQAGVDVANDEMQASLYFEARGDDPALLADRANAAMREALRRTRAAAGVRAQSDGYETEPVLTFNPKTQKSEPAGWRLRQGLRLTSGDFAALRRLLGQLQTSLQVGSVRFVVSPDARKQAEDEALRRAIAAFGERARLIDAALGASGHDLRALQVSLTGQDEPPRPVMRAMASAAAAAPEFAPGLSRITATASGSIHLIRH